MRERLRPVTTIAVTAFQASAGLATVSFTLAVSMMALFAVQPVFFKHLANGAVRHDTGQAFAAVLGLVITSGLGLMAAWFSFTLRMTLQERTALLLDRRIIAATAGIASIEHHERPDLLDKIELLRTEREQLASAPDSLVFTLGNAVRVLIAGGLLASVHPVLLLLPVFSVPALLVTARNQRIYQDHREDLAESHRLSTHLYDLATTAGPGKELRVFGLRQEIEERFADLWRDLVARRDAVYRRTLVPAIGAWSVFGIGYAGAITFTCWLAVRGRASVGDVFLAVTIAAQINQQMTGLVNTITWFQRGLRVVGRYRWLLDYAAEQDARRPRGDARRPAPAQLRHGIDFTGVAFRYPATDTDVLHDVDLHLPAGTTIAIVGDNGAGKTTLVKLLGRMYEPTAGTITVEGVPMSAIDPDDWRACCSSAFQDHARFELVLREVVGVGNLPAIDDDPAVMAALTRASAVDVLDRLPTGLASQLGKSFDDGVELSSGQWQKLALGRAMMREDPLLLVLDEPTAALDADTEHALFERYAGAARRVARDTGGITVLVSHRFSTVRMADLIVVVDGGTIRECGTHAQLLARAGLYAELYRLQARAYR